MIGMHQGYPFGIRLDVEFVFIGFCVSLLEIRVRQGSN
jgi:hypothetical protein